MDSEKNVGQLDKSRRKILQTAASIGVTGAIAGCQDTDTSSTQTGTGETTEPGTARSRATGTDNTTPARGTLQRDGAEAMPASPIATHPRELALEPSAFGDGWELVSSQTVLDGDAIYRAVDEGEQVTAQEIRWENTAQGAQSLYGPTIFTDADAAAEVITTTEEGVRNSDAADYPIDIGDSAVLYTTANGNGRDIAGVVVQERNATVGMSYYGPEETPISEWPDTVRPFIQSAHTPLAESY